MLMEGKNLVIIHDIEHVCTNLKNQAIFALTLKNWNVMSTIQTVDLFQSPIRSSFKK